VDLLNAIFPLLVAYIKFILPLGESIYLPIT